MTNEIDKALSEKEALEKKLLKPVRKQRPKGRESLTKKKGTPAVGNQRKTLYGQPGAPKPGLTSEQAFLRSKNGEIAERIQHNFLNAVSEAVEKTTDPEQIMAHIRSDILRLVHDALDRHQGKALSRVDNTSSDGSATMPSVIRLVGPDSEDAS